MKTFLFGVSLFIIGLILCVSLCLSQDWEDLRITCTQQGFSQPSCHKMETIPLPQEQTARMSLGVIGGGVGCTTAVYSQATRNNYEYHADTYLAGSFTAGSSYPLCKVDVITAYGGTPTGVVQAHIFNDNAGSPGTNLGTSTNSITASTLAQQPSYATATFNFSGVSITESSVYWIALSHTNTFNIYLHENYPVTGPAFKRSANGVDWTLLTADGSVCLITYK